MDRDCDGKLLVLKTKVTHLHFSHGLQQTCMAYVCLFLYVYMSTCKQFVPMCMCACLYVCMYIYVCRILRTRAHYGHKDSVGLVRWSAEDDTKEILAGREAQRLKRLISGVRYLFRNGPCSRNAVLQQMKKICRKSPRSAASLLRRRRRQASGGSRFSGCALMLSCDGKKCSRQDCPSTVLC